MADSLAIQLGKTLIDLLRNRKPTVPRAKWETNYAEPFSISDSPNKQATSNACELVWAINNGHIEIVNRVLKWFRWLRSEPFMPKECLTPEEAYRALTAYPMLVAAGVAHQLGESATKIACLDLARAHAAWLLLGIGMKPGRKVVDHHLDGVNVPCVLIGTGSPNFPVRYVAQAGDRGWIRNRSKNQPKVFLFTDHVGLSVIVYQALGLPLHRKVRKACADQVETLDAILDRWPGLPVWGFSSVDQVMAKRFFDNPVDPELAAEIVNFLLPPERALRFVRFNEGSIVSCMEDTDASSTDWLMLDACYAGGETRKTSADDGNRDEVLQQTGWEEDVAFACRRRDGGGQTMRIPKPTLPIVAWKVLCKDGVIRFEGANADPFPLLPITPGFAPDAPKEKVSWMEKLGI